jgi:hypothetical protein
MASPDETKGVKNNPLIQKIYREDTESTEKLKIGQQTPQ